MKETDEEVYKNKKRYKYMSKSSNLQKLQVLKLWLETQKTRSKHLKKKREAFVIDDEE